MTDEQETIPIEEGENTTGTADDGNTEQTLNIVEQARAERKGIEEALRESKEVLKQLQELRAQDIIGGKSKAGVKPKMDKSPAEYADDVLNNRR